MRPTPRGAPGGVLLPPGVGLPPLALLEKEGGREKEERGAPPLPCPIRTRGGGDARPTLDGPPLLPYGPFSPFSYGPMRPNTNSRNSPVLRKIPESLGAFPMSGYSRPIYRSLHLDHFETPRHVRDHIQDSEQPSVHQNTKTLITIVTKL